MNLTRICPGNYNITEKQIVYGYVRRVTGNLGYPVYNVGWAGQVVRGLSTLADARAFVRLNADAIREVRPITPEERDKSPLPPCPAEIELDSAADGYEYELRAYHCDRPTGHQGPHRTTGTEETPDYERPSTRRRRKWTMEWTEEPMPYDERDEARWIEDHEPRPRTELEQSVMDAMAAMEPQLIMPASYANVLKLSDTFARLEKEGATLQVPRLSNLEAN